MSTTKPWNKAYLLMVAFLFALAGCGGASTAQIEGRVAPLLEGMGALHHEITTDVPMAQRFFNQGLVLSYAFNHAEAERSFREAARLDSECAMCYWGIALVLGPNTNATMDPENVPPAYAALQQARHYADGASEKEQAYIEALSARYAEQPPEDRSSLDQAYADAMRDVAQRYPDDMDALTLFAEALMDTTPWDYWTDDGAPKEKTKEILATLETVMERAPEHPGANHLYIHAVEAVHPQRGVAAADRLGDLVPGAGHLVHMPGHIYIRVGRYHDASLANEQAIAADESYTTQCHAQGMYPLVYMPHNHHFLWAASTMEGRSEVALRAAEHMAAHQDQKKMREAGYETLQHYWITPLYALTRFGKWDEILRTLAPEEDLVYPTGVWHYAQGMAFTRKGQLDKAVQELEALQAIAANPVLESVTVWDLNTTAHLMKIATEVLAGELAAAQGDYDRAIAHLQAGVSLEDALNYDEPSPWYHPVRQILGAVLLKAGQPAEAEKVYRADLEIFPKNGWSLYGLEQSLKTQEKTEEAKIVKAQFEEAWTYADVVLESSRL